MSFFAKNHGSYKKISVLSKNRLYQYNGFPTSSAFIISYVLQYLVYGSPSVHYTILKPVVNELLMCLHGGLKNLYTNTSKKKALVWSVLQELKTFE